jgi:hypothetical protein
LRCVIKMLAEARAALIQIWLWLLLFGNKLIYGIFQD